MGFRPEDALATRPSLVLRPKSAERRAEGPGPFAPEVLDRFESDRAVGLVLIDATPLLQIEELAGPPAYLQALETLTQRARTAARRALGDPLFVARSVGQDAQLLVFVHRDRGQGAFYAEELPAAANEMRLLLEGQLRRVGYPYLTGPLQLGIGHSFVLYRPYQRPETQLRRLIEFARDSARFETERLRRARNAEFEQILLEKRIICHYEPIVRLEDLTLVGYEGLARGPMESPLRSPIALFETAEGLGLDYELDCLCRELALRGARELPPGAKLFVNCLPAAVHDPNFKPAQIRQALEGVGLSPSDLVLEVSERQAILSYEVFRNALTAFTEMGFAIAVDDMGAGYSSLAAALEIRPGFLKIDRSLIDGIDGDPPRQELVRAIQVLADRMKALIVAEGIEQQAELEVLKDLGVACGQGYLFGRGGARPHWPARLSDDTPGSTVSVGRLARGESDDSLADETPGAEGAEHVPEGEEDALGTRTRLRLSDWFRGLFPDPSGAEEGSPGAESPAPAPEVEELPPCAETGPDDDVPAQRSPPVPDSKGETRDAKTGPRPNRRGRRRRKGRRKKTNPGG